MPYKTRNLYNVCLGLFSNTVQYEGVCHTSNMFSGNSIKKITIEYKRLDNLVHRILKIHATLSCIKKKKVL